VNPSQIERADAIGVSPNALHVLEALGLRYAAPILRLFCCERELVEVETGGYL
jgi:hypothetical protein